MKSFVAILALVAVAAADVSHLQPRSPEYDAQTLKEVNEVGPESFGYAFETSNGISAQESGALRVLSPESAAIVVQGANSHTAPTGEQISLTYIADENGYQPQGAHLPTPPPPQEIPEYILRAIEYIRANPPKPEQPKRI